MMNDASSGFPHHRRIERPTLVRRRVPVAAVLTIALGFLGPEGAGAQARIPLNYTRSAFAQAYAPISTGGGAVKLLATSDDSVRSIPLPFPFTYSGLTFTTQNFLAVSANGFVYPSRSSATTSISTQSDNINLYFASSPNATIAPWYDDLSVAGVGTNPAGSVLYQTQGSAGSRKLTVQWTDVSSFANTSGGQPRVINFQVVLYENTNVIEFRYGPISGSGHSTLETASVGLEDSLSGNGFYIDGVTGSKLTNNRMMTTNKWPGSVIRFTPGSPAPIAAGTYDIGAGGAYASLSEAVADLNQRGVSGPVTIRLADGIHDSSSAGGKNIFPILLGPVTGTSLSNLLNFEPIGGVPTLRHRGTETGFCGNQATTTAIGSSNEPVLGLIGADYVVVRGIAVQGGPTVDRGILVIPSDRDDGAQNNRIIACSVSLDRSNVSSIGVQQFMPVSPSDASGTNSGNFYQNLTISNVYAGVSLAGNATVLDAGCEVSAVEGGTSTIGGPSAGDIGNGAAATFGVRLTNQRDVSVFNVEIRNIAGTSTGAVDGVFLDNLSTSSASSGTCRIFNNKIHDLENMSTSAGRVSGIRANLTQNASSASRIYNNFIYSLNSGSTATSSRRLIGINLQESGGGTGATHSVDFNSVSLSPLRLTFPNSCFEIGTATGPRIRVRNNVFANFVGTQQGSGKHYTWVTPSTSSIGPSGSVSDRNVLHINNVAGGFVGLAGGVDRPDLASWQGVAGTDTASLTGNPGFLSDTDLHIDPNTPSPVESHGSDFGGAISWVTTDFDGQPRAVSTPDIGADEGNFTLLAVNDMAAAAFVEPTPGQVRFVNTSFTPRATFENSGTRNQTNIPVRFKIIGPSPSTAVVYNQTATLPALSSGSSDAISFANATIVQSGQYTMEVRVELAGDEVSSNNVLSGALEIAGPLSGTFHVGTAQPFPFNTLTNAISRLNGVGVSGPLTLLLDDASYGPAETFPITITPVVGGGPTRPVTIRPSPGVSPAITGSSSKALVVFDGADYVTLDGTQIEGGSSRDLTLTNTNPSLGSAVVWGQTTFGGDAVTNVTVKNCVLVGNSPNQTLIGIGFGAPTVGLVSNGTANHNNVIENCKIKRTQYGIYSSGASATNKNTGTVITRNSIDAPPPDNIFFGGILVRFENGVQITQNQIADIYSTAIGPAFGIAVGLRNVSSSTFAGDEVTNATVSRNVIKGVVSNYSDGLSAAGITIAQATSGITTIVNNVITGVSSNAKDPDLTVGILAGGGTGSTTRIYFNSVSMTGSRGLATAPSLALGIGGINPTMDVRNNILFNRQTSTTVGPSYAIGLNYQDHYENLTSNYNDLWTGNTVIAVIGGLINDEFGEVDFANWKSKTHDDGNSKSADPLFVSNSDLHITQSGSPVANAGSPISGVTTDFEGDLGKRTTTPDIGADEFGTQLLNVTVIGNGTVTKNPNQPNYILNAVVQLTATPAVGYHFVGWSGDASGSTNPLNVTMNRDKNITATFALNQYTINATVVGSGAVGRNPNQATYPYGSSVVVTATPALGHHFVAWSGDTSGTNPSLTFTMRANKNLTATFAINTYSLSVNAVGPGSVTKNPNQASYNHGTTVVLTPVPNPGYHFVSWSGDASGSANPLNVTMDGPKSITATFAINTYSINLTTVGIGTVAKTPNQATYDHGTTVQLVATPGVDYHFVNWTGDVTSTNDTIMVLMDGPKNLTVTFEVNGFRLTANTVGNGTVAKNPDLPLYDGGSTVQVTASPGGGANFVKWSGDGTGSANPLPVLMDRDKTVTATFSNTTVPLNVTVVGSGSVARTPDQRSYDTGTAVLLRAVPGFGYHFTGWSGDAAGSSDTVTVIMGGPRNVTATFAINTYTLDVSVVGSGSVSKTPNQSPYTHGSAVKLTATANANFQFLNYSGDTSGTTDTLTVIMDRNKNVTATFVDAYTLDVTIVGSGGVVKVPNQVNYLPGTVVRLTATPGTEYHFGGWSGDRTSSFDTLSVVMNGNKNLTATFLINTYAINLTTVGNGSVVKNPNQASHDYGSVVQFTATPAPGNFFAGWTGDRVSSSDTLSLVVDRKKSLTATFQVITHTVNVTNVGAGSVVRNPDGPNYVEGSKLLLTATPANGYHFTGWSGDVSGQDNPLSIMMDTNKNVTSTFTINSYTLGVSVSGNGTVGKNPDQPTYRHGTAVQLTATPATGYHFVGWSGDAVGSANPLTVVMDKNQTVTATFEINNYSLDVSSVGNGYVTRSPDTSAYVHGSNVTLTAVPAVGYHLTVWGGDASGSTNPLSVTMDGNKSVVATFDINIYPLNVSAVGNGTVTKDPDQVYYNHGTTVSVTATPAFAHHLVNWSGDASGSFNPLSVVMDQEKTIAANFALNTYTLDVTTVGSGTVTKIPDQPSYDHGTTVRLTNHPQVGHRFVSWTGDTTASSDTLEIVMTRNRSVTGNFAERVFTLDVSAAGNGTVVRDPDRASYTPDAKVTITATPAVGHHFTGWSGHASGMVNPLSMVMDTNKTVVGHFAINTYPLNVSVVDSGSVIRTPNQTSYDHGTQVRLIAAPAFGYHFVEWSGDTSATEDTLLLVMTGPKNLNATFSINSYGLSITTVGNGTVAHYPDQPVYIHGTEVILGANADPGHAFVGWSGSVNGSTTPLTIVMDSDKNVTATFQIKTYTLGVTASGHGTVLRNPSLPRYENNSSVQVTAVPDSGYRFVDWIGDASGSANPLSVMMDRDKSITARFREATHTLTVNLVGGTGRVVKYPDMPRYSPGANVDIYVYPDTGYQFVDFQGWPFNPVNATIDSNMTLNVQLRPGPVPTLNVAVVGDGSVTKNPNKANYLGETVVLTATPDSARRFIAWSGDWYLPDPTTNPLTVFVTRDMDLTATFESVYHSLSVGTVGAGSVTRDPVRTFYHADSAVTLTATPSAGYHFIGWSGDTSTTTNPLVLPMYRDRSVTVVFGFALAATSGGNGTVVKSPDQPFYPPGTTVQLTPVPQVGYHFAGWSGSDTTKRNPLFVTMDADKSITGSFMIGVTMLDIVVIGDGTVVKTPDQAAYDYGSTVELVAFGNPGWHFVGWSEGSGDQAVPRNPGGTRCPDCVSGAESPIYVVMHGSRTIRATFEPNGGLLMIARVGGGNVLRDVDLPAYENGTVVALTAVPDSGYVFVGWSGDVVSTSNPVSLTVEGARSLTAHFASTRGALPVEVVGSGSVVEKPGAEGENTVWVQATPDPGWRFQGWGGDATGSDNPVKTTRGAARGITATFVEAIPPVARLRAPGGGARFTIGVPATLEWTATDNVGVMAVDVLLSRTGPAGPYEVLVQGAPNSGSFVWQTTGPTASRAYLRLVAHDAAGNVAADTVGAAIGSVHDASATAVGEFALDPPWPNPTLGNSTIEFAVAREARVRLTVVDVQGREVARLADGTYRPGRYQVTWSGEIGRGNAAPGVYFVRLRSQGREWVRRLLIAR